MTKHTFLINHYIARGVQRSTIAKGAREDMKSQWKSEAPRARDYWEIIIIFRYKVASSGSS